MSLVDVIVTLIGTPITPAGEVILYTLSGILLMVVIKEMLALLHLLIKVIGRMA